MKPILVLALCLAGAPLLGAQDAPKKARVPKHLVERFQKLSPADKQRLRERLAELKKLGPEERRRLVENLAKFRRLPEARKQDLRERFEKLPADEKRRLGELASGFNRWAQHRFPGLEKFPRGAFFKWAAVAHPDRLERLKGSDEGARRAEFLQLSEEYRRHLTGELRRHARAHQCVPVEDVDRLADQAFREFWAAAEALSSRCPRRKPPQPPPDRSGGGPVRPPKPH